MVEINQEFMQKERVQYGNELVLQVLKMRQENGKPMSQYRIARVLHLTDQAIYIGIGLTLLNNNINNSNIHYKPLRLTATSLLCKGLRLSLLFALVALTAPSVDLFASKTYFVKENLTKLQNTSGFPLQKSSKSLKNSLINLEIVSFIESSNNPLAINKLDNGGIGSYGLHQISPYALSDFNKAHKTSLKPSDCLKAETSSRVADWYINKEIPRLLKHFKKRDTLENRLTAWNMGIGAVIKGKTATRYITKYRSLKNV